MSTTPLDVFLAVESVNYSKLEEIFKLNSIEYHSGFLEIFDNHPNTVCIVLNDRDYGEIDDEEKLLKEAKIQYSTYCEGYYSEVGASLENIRFVNGKLKHQCFSMDVDKISYDDLNDIINGCTDLKELKLKITEHQTIKEMAPW
jgi:hypothetical protein